MKYPRHNKEKVNKTVETTMISWKNEHQHVNLPNYVETTNKQDNHFEPLVKVVMVNDDKASVQPR